MLRLHAKRRAPRVCAAFALKRPVEKITCVELKTRFGGKNFQNASRFGVGHLSSAFKTRSGAIEYPVVVISAAEDQLFILLLDTFSNRVASAKIEWRSRDALELARRN